MCVRYYALQHIEMVGTYCYAIPLRGQQYLAHPTSLNRISENDIDYRLTLAYDKNPSLFLWLFQYA
jgi:hypothetical protein